MRPHEDCVAEDLLHWHVMPHYSHFKHVPLRECLCGPECTYEDPNGNEVWTHWMMDTSCPPPSH